MFKRIFYFKYRFTLIFEIMVPKRLLSRIYGGGYRVTFWETLTYRFSRISHRAKHPVNKRKNCFVYETNSRKQNKT